MTQQPANTNQQPTFILLTHEREFERPTNTAQCTVEVLAERLWQPVWRRTEPNERLLKLIQHQQVGLLYPAEGEPVDTVAASDCQHWLLLDATWQEARKMYNRSRYLHALPRITFQPESRSEYRLRRNQKPQGLSTAECMIQLLKDNAEPVLAAQLLKQFQQFNG